MRRLLLATMLGVMLVPGQARACMAENFQRALIHNAVPHSLPSDWIVADVRFLSTHYADLEGNGVAVEVRRMIQGDYRGRTMIVIHGSPNSCSAPFKNGTEGLVVGIPFDMLGGRLVVGLIEAGAYDGYRLPDDAWPGAPGDRMRARLERRRAQFRAEILVARLHGEESTPPAQGE